MNCHIKCSKCPPLANTRLQSLSVVFHSIVSGLVLAVMQTKLTKVHC